MNGSAENTSPKNQIERQTGAAYNRDFAPAFVAYVAIVLSIMFFVDFEDAAWWKYLLALTPVIPALWGVRAVKRHLGRIDEMWRQTHLESMATGFGVAMVVAMTVGFAANAGLDTNRWGSWVIYACGMLAWAASAARRGAPC